MASLRNSLILSSRLNFALYPCSLGVIGLRIALLMMTAFLVAVEKSGWQSKIIYSNFPKFKRLEFTL